MRNESDKLYRQIVCEGGHFYVCGDCKMAEDVCQTLRTIIQEQSGMTNVQMDNYLWRMRVSISNVKMVRESESIVLIAKETVFVRPICKYFC